MIKQTMKRTTRLRICKQILNKVIISRVYVTKPIENYEFTLANGSVVHVNGFGNVCYFYQAAPTIRKLRLPDRPSMADCLGRQLKNHPHDEHNLLLYNVDRRLRDLRDRFQRQDFLRRLGEIS